MSAAENKPARAKAKRTTITLQPIVHEWGAELQQQNGFRSLSDLIDFLIRVQRMPANSAK